MLQNKNFNSNDIYTMNHLNMIHSMKSGLTIMTLILLTPFCLAASNPPEKVFVINEGAFGQANASVTVFYPESGEHISDVFSTVNNRMLGDVANDAQWINGRLFVVVSNSHKIEALDPVTYESVETILIDSEEHGGSPRSILQVAADKAYVTNLFGDNISIIDLDTGSEIGTIDVGPGPEGIARSGNYAFVALSGMGQGNEVAVIDIAADELVTRLSVGDNPIHLAEAPDGKIWSVATGNYGYDENFQYDPGLETFGEIVIIDPVTLEISDRFDTGGHPGKLVFIDEKQALLQLGGLKQIDVENLFLIDEYVLERSMYSFDIARGTHEDDPLLYVTVAPDFSSSGWVVSYDMSGEVIDSFQAGIGPGAMAFLYQQATGVEQEPAIAEELRLHQNYPNPFNPETMISFQIPASGNIRLEVYDALGRRVKSLVDGWVPEGEHTIAFNASGLAGGAYLYRLTYNGLSRTRYMLLIK